MEYVKANLENLEKIKCNVIEIKNDEFKNEFKIFSTRLKTLYLFRWISIHEDAPINVLYKSNSSGERIFLTPDDEKLWVAKKSF